ncbi:MULTISPECIES: acyl-CoA dehydrogenase family protein [Bradyrhizobium]|jgi:alkylation response protein AidB-like acyl-CoA dehydrogenase|uniref:Acyl-CoA dehydrogenase n=2 Tax=Bradyrhizobium TaxID=374 RepID=A0ABY0PVF9_9BRAD|nr:MULTISPECIES: acyl-CoA dehydrogenase family protein [Bradyrhizobium]SDI95755.1 Acyl-CoA dehydrogenase [Bradyrhizobium ottawaense]SED05564.1 Acyl-CoA dehydrogenase [Bradyrhizobium lablabi]SHL12410.1 Acyl-CoA dehydrogenase [Bradyrhizobium lablabi]
MNRQPGIDLVGCARALQPLIAGDADEIERTRRLTPAVTSALVENGLYRSLLPQSLGGSEAPLETFMQMQEEIAKADASTAWCLGQCSVCAMTAAYLDPDAASEIFNTTPGILAWGAVAHEVQAVPGGYRASARWDFASGSRQASWLGAHVRVVEADGTQRRKKDGSPEIRTILFPMASATMYDVWDVIGLRGTGTDSYSVENLFIPEKFAALRDDPTALRENGPLYKLTTNMVFSMGFGATSLGVARATLDAATDLARGKTPQGLKAMRDNNAVQGLIGRTEATLRAARAYLYTTAGEVWRDLARGDPLTEQHRIALRIAATWTIHQSAAVVDTAYHMAGATAVFAANKFERRFRDMHAIAQQIQARDTHYEDAGKAILSASLGTPPTAR